MEFENYSRRINSVNEIESFGHAINEKHSQFRFSVKKNEMVFEQIEKSKFAQINDKRYYFSDRIVLPLSSHPFLHKINQFKEDKNKKNEAFLLEEKDKLLRMEENAIAKSQRLSLYRSIL